MRRIVIVLVVGIFLGLGYALWQYGGTGKSGKSSSDERFKVTDLGVAPDPKSTGADEAKESTVEEKIAWGKETRGLVANFRALTTAVEPGEPIEFELRVKNVSDKDLLVTSSGEKLSACFWTFYFDQWEWRSAQDSARVLPMKAGETVSVRCLVATRRDSMTAEQKTRFRFPPPVPFRHVQNKNETDRLPEGTYRVYGKLDGGLESNTIEMRIIQRR